MPVHFKKSSFYFFLLKIVCGWVRRIWVHFLTFAKTKQLFFSYCSELLIAYKSISFKSALQLRFNPYLFLCNGPNKADTALKFYIYRNWGPVLARLLLWQSSSYEHGSIWSFHFWIIYSINFTTLLKEP